MKGQGTIEYLVILAIIVVVSLIVVSLITTSTNPAGISAGESKLYWQAQPLAITEAAIDSEGDGKLVIKNNTGELIEIIEVLVDGKPVFFDDGTLSYDGKLVLHAQYLEPCNGTGSYEIEITYKSENYLIKKVSGDMPLIVDCDEDIPALFLEAGVSLIEPNNGGVGSKNQNFVFSVSGSNINQCTLISTNIVGDYNVVGSELTGEQTISVSGLTGMGTNYEWNVECCNVRGECTQADSNFSFIIPNQAPVVSFNPEPSGTYSGGVPFTLDVSDADGAVSEITAQIYYKDAADGTPVPANSVDLTKCFPEGDYENTKSCGLEWQIDNDSISGDYWIDVNVFDGEMNTLVSTGSVTINPCVMLSGDYVVNDDTDLCSGNYALDDGDASGIIRFETSGSVGNPITLDCHGATISGTGTYGIYANDSDNLEIKNCNFLGYNQGVIIKSNNVLIEDSNFSSTLGTGYGIRLQGWNNVGMTTNDINIQNVDVSGRQYGIWLSGNSNSITNAERILVENSNLSNSVSGFRRDHRVVLYDVNLNNNDISNSSTWAVDMGNYKSYRTNVRNDNDLTGSANGLYLTEENVIRNYDFSNFNIPGEVIRFSGSHNLVIDSNLSKPGARSGTGIRTYSWNNVGMTVDDVNIIRTDLSNRQYGLWITGHSSSTTSANNILVEDSILRGNEYGIRKENTIEFSGLTIIGNDFSNSSLWAIYMYPVSSRVNENFVFTEDNKLNNSANGVWFGSNTTLENIDFGDQNIPGTALMLSGNNITIKDVNVANIHSKSGKGVYLHPYYSPGLTMQDINIVRLDASNREYGVYTYGHDNGGRLRRINIHDSKFKGNSYGFYNTYTNEVTNSTMPAIIEDFNIKGNDFSNVTAWAVQAHPISSLTNYGYVITNDNILTNAANGFFIGGGVSIKDWDFSDSNISGIIFYLCGNNTLLENVDLSKDGEREGSPLRLRPYYAPGKVLWDVNIVSVNVSNREKGVYIYGHDQGTTVNGLRVIDSNFSGNIFGVYNNAADEGHPHISESNILNVTLSGNNFSNISSWAALMRPRSDKTNYGYVITNDNVMNNALNGFWLGGGVEVSDWDLSDANVHGIVFRLSGNDSHMENVNLSQSGDKGNIGINLHPYFSPGKEMMDVNLFGITINNREYAMYLNGHDQGTTLRRLNIKDSYFLGNTNVFYNIAENEGHAHHNSSILYDFDITGNVFENTSNWALLLKRSQSTGGGHYINNNDFISNISNINSNPVSNANGNYWSDQVDCPNPYSFTGGTDSSPVCSPIN